MVGDTNGKGFLKEGDGLSLGGGIVNELSELLGIWKATGTVTAGSGIVRADDSWMLIAGACIIGLGSGRPKKFMGGLGSY